MIIICFFSSDQEHNFEKNGLDKADTLNIPYDFSSIMHYGKYAFALDRKFVLYIFLTSHALSEECCHRNYHAVGSILGRRQVYK